MSTESFQNGGMSFPRLDFAVAAAFSLIALAHSAAAEVKVPVLNWGPCPPAAEGKASTAPFQCATATVPLDYARPDSGNFTLALIRHPAAKPDQRIGTLFWNPGGPSDAGTEYLPASLMGFPEAVRERFDIVSWDPRGMGGGTTPVIQCFENAAAEAQFMETHFTGTIARTTEDLMADSRARADFNAACIARNGDLLKHVSTADNARDLDLLRQAVGEEKLSYYGTSYGTFLGATYINMFPDHVRAAVLDGGVAPSAWAGGAGEDLSLSTFIRLGSDLGSATTIDAFITACGAASARDCAFSAGSPAATREKWQKLLQRARSEGLHIEGETIDDGALLSYVASSVYLVDPLPGFDRFPGYKAVAETLEAFSQPATTTATASETVRKAASTAPETYTTSAGRQLAVICGESPNPETPETIARQAELSFARAGLSPWPFTASCLGWTARATAPYLGPWNNRTAQPVLVIANSFDPATAFGSSVRLAQELDDARLLPVNGFGHTVLLNPSHCAQDHITAYLTALALPPTGAACSEDHAPFGG